MENVANDKNDDNNGTNGLIDKDNSIKRSKTLYVRNLSEKIPRDSKMIPSLYALFKEYGTVLDIKVGKRMNAKGQAWILFPSEDIAENAMNKLKGFVFFDKELDINFAKENKNKTPLEKRIASRMDRLVQKISQESTIQQQQDGNQKRQNNNSKRGREEEDNNNNNEQLSKKPNTQQKNNNASIPVPPNKTLFATQLPAEVTKLTLEVLFKQYPGLVEIRLAAGSGIAFIEFGTIEQATIALMGMNKFEITSGVFMSLSYAKS